VRDLRTVDARCIQLGDDGGAFVVLSPIDRAQMVVVASHGMSWDHVSVSRKNRAPNWAEMEIIAQIFFKEDEVAVQYHVPASLHINNHPYCLHWFRPQTAEMPLPPPVMIGRADLGLLTRDEALRVARESGMFG
jgi:hypothetical protein